MLIIDRLEGMFAVCEQDDGSMRSYPQEKFQPEAKEGGCYQINGEIFLLDEAETERRREENVALFAEIFGETL